LNPATSRYGEALEKVAKGGANTSKNIPAMRNDASQKANCRQIVGNWMNGTHSF
jgi:hypothetical protein